MIKKSVIGIIASIIILWSHSSLYADKLREVLDKLPFEAAGFLEVSEGVRIYSDPYEKKMTLNEIRLRLEATKYFDWLELSWKEDFLYDGVLDTWRGEVRDLNAFVPFDMFSVKAGRQVLTWGTGDLIFINDLFPKDWQSFLIGRETEYLKKPSDALKISIYPEFVTIDLVYTPRFKPDNYITGQRISYYNPALGRIVGMDDRIEVETPDKRFTNSEFAMRLKKYIGSMELAGYFYNGYWKTPAGFDPNNMKFTFPPLTVYGMSIRGNILKGIGNAEIGYYDSRDDDDGDNPDIENSQIRLLLGYERELWEEATIGLQYYLEHMLYYSEYKENTPNPSTLQDENRHVLTLRLTQFLLQQNLKLSIFTYFSPSDEDLYSRPIISYKLSDAWTVTTGGNIFLGKKDYTFFGQFEDNSNVYVRLKYSF